MQDFVFEGATYRFDAVKCYDGDGLIALPDGRLLKVGGWLESYPPQPVRMTVLAAVPAVKIELPSPLQQAVDAFIAAVGKDPRDPKTWTVVPT